MNERVYAFLLLLGNSALYTTQSRCEEPTISRTTNVKITNDARMVGFVISSMISPNMFSCVHTCLRTNSCASFNFRSSNGAKGTCELNSQKFIYKNKKPRHRNGWTYGILTGKKYEVNVTFTTLNGFGAKGPKDTSGYQGTILHKNVQLHNGIQIWTVPIRGTYTIKVLGASGGNGTNDTSSWRLGGLGAQIQGDFFLMEGTVLKILVGQRGLCAPTGSRRPGGGGGGSFVTSKDNKPLIIAGGGGGGAAPWIGFHHGDNAQITSNGSTHGGTQGTGGRLYDVYYKTYDRRYGAAAGGGLLTNGASGNFTPGGQAFVNGGEGGVGKELAEGGFGGGGAAYTYPGGGGGYSGGGVVRATRYTVAGGGGSFNGGTNQYHSTAVHMGPGRVEIRLVQSHIDMM